MNQTKLCFITSFTTTMVDSLKLPPTDKTATGTRRGNKQGLPISPPSYYCQVQGGQTKVGSFSD